jgi:hypothetical protein
MRQRTNSQATLKKEPDALVALEKIKNGTMDQHQTNREKGASEVDDSSSNYDTGDEKEGKPLFSRKPQVV